MHDIRDETGELRTTYQGTITTRGSGGANSATAQLADAAAEIRAVEALGAVDSDPAARGAAPSFPYGC